jgi:hypothetical protein
MPSLQAAIGGLVIAASHDLDLRATAQAIPHMAPGTARVRDEGSGAGEGPIHSNVERPAATKKTVPGLPTGRDDVKIDGSIWRLSTTFANVARNNEP